MQQASLRKSARIATQPAITYYNKRPISTVEGATRKRAAPAKKNNKTNSPISAVPTISTDVNPVIQDPQHNKDIVNQGPTALVQSRGTPSQSGSKLGALMTDERIATFVARVQKADSSNPFRELATAIIYQQLSGKVAEKIERRFIDLFGPPENAHKLWFPTPERVVDQSIETLRSVGLSIRKAEYIKGLAEKFIDKTITIEKLSTLSDEELSKLLCSVRGIGPWTADMYLMLNLGHPDVLPVSDLGVRKGVGIHFELKNKLPSPKEMEEATNIWRPYRSVGSWFMWQLMSITTL